VPNFEIMKIKTIENEPNSAIKNVNDSVLISESPTDKPPVFEALDGANADEISDSLIGSMSDVQQHAIDLEAQKTNETSELYSHLTDKNGTQFTPELHKVKRDGSPTISKLGKLMLKPNSANKGNTQTASASTTQNSDHFGGEIPEMSEAQKQKCVALGKVSAAAIFSAGRMLGGEEWTPQKSGGYDEAAAMQEAFSEYYIATGKSEISPTTGLILAIGAYAAPRFTMPKTQAKTKSITQKAFAWWHNRKGKKEANAANKAEEFRKASEKKESVKSDFVLDA
jgi:hypothetical protein